MTTRHMLAELKKPTGEEMCIKTEEFQGVLICKSSYERDVAEAVMRVIGWPWGLPVRARNVFFLGFRWQLGE